MVKHKKATKGKSKPQHKPLVVVPLEPEHVEVLAPIIPAEHLEELKEAVATDDVVLVLARKKSWFDKVMDWITASNT